MVNTEYWIFGSTEDSDRNIAVAAGTMESTESWFLNGTFSQAMATFKKPYVVHGRLYHPDLYYTSYRCSKTSKADLPAALTAANAVSTDGYNFLTNNCLTKALAVFVAYDPTLHLQPGDSAPPYDYYLGLGDQWGDAMSL